MAHWRTGTLFVSGEVVKINSFVCAGNGGFQDEIVFLEAVGIDFITTELRRIFFWLNCQPEINDVAGMFTARLKLMGEDKLLKEFSQEFRLDDGAPRVGVLMTVMLPDLPKGPIRFDASIDGAEGVASWPLTVVRQRPG
jgi:hypothetical protein